MGKDDSPRPWEISCPWSWPMCGRDFAFNIQEGKRRDVRSLCANRAVAPRTIVDNPPPGVGSLVEQEWKPHAIHPRGPTRDARQPRRGSEPLARAWEHVLSCPGASNGAFPCLAADGSEAIAAARGLCAPRGIRPRPITALVPGAPTGRRSTGYDESTRYPTSWPFPRGKARWLPCPLT